MEKVSSEFADLSYSVKKNRRASVVYFSLIMRSLFFLIIGLLFVGVYHFLGSDHPFKEAQKYWPYQAIFANVFTFILIRFFLKRENQTYSSMFRSVEIGNWKKIQEYGLLLIAGIIGGAVPLYLFSYLLLGSITPPDIHFQALPIGLSAIALILFPLSNALVETPTYLGYALPRLKRILGNTYIAILLAAFGLALQHVFLPIVLHFDYMLWRLFSFIPLAVILGFIFNKTNRLWPIVVIHFLMDLQLVAQMFINSLG